MSSYIMRVQQSIYVILESSIKSFFFDNESFSHENCILGRLVEYSVHKRHNHTHTCIVREKSGLRP